MQIKYTPRSPAVTLDLTDAQVVAICLALARGNKIRAIRLLRHFATGMGLKDAKDVVETTFNMTLSTAERLNEEID